MKKTNIYWDIECYSNYFYIRFHNYRNYHTYEARLFNDVLELGDRAVIARFISKHTLIGFNTDNYDMPMLAAFLGGYNNKALKYLSDKIVKSSDPWWLLSRKFPKITLPDADTIDLVGVTPLMASLKTYACRIHTKTLEDLPLPPDTVIRREHVAILESYCANDLHMTQDIHVNMTQDIRLREDMTQQYGIDFRSKSGPQIAEGVLRSTLNEADVVVQKRTGSVKPFQYKMPDFIRFETEELRAVQRTVRDAIFQVDDKHRVNLPDALNVAIDFDGAKYKLGIGGLHSQEKHQAVVAGSDILGEWDVASMYPSIILGQGLYPEHIGPEFCDVYRDIFDTRMAAKAAGDKTVSDSLKLVLNSSFGKFGNHYSFLYSPELLIQTTLTGQLSLLMLIEMFYIEGIKTVSANTDGVVVVHHLPAAADQVVQDWQEATGWTLEWTPYRAIYSESVNSYLAIKPDASVKLKGTYAGASIAKGYQNEICVDAITAYLTHGIPLADTILQCQDVTKFLTMRGIRSGGVWRDNDVGRVARWYVSVDGEEIRYKTNGNKVAGSDDAVPMLTLGPVPDDINRDWYVTRSITLLKKLGVDHV